MAHITTVTPNPSLDDTLLLDRLPSVTEPGDVHGEEFVTADLLQTPGGKGSNCARAAVRLSLKTTAICASGGWEGQRHGELLEESGVGVEQAQLGCSLRRHTTLVAREPETVVRRYRTGPAGGRGKVADPELFQREMLESAVESLKKGADVLACTGSLPVGANQGLYPTLIAKGREAGTFTVLDASGEVLTSAISARPSLLKINAEEASVLSGKAPEGQEKALLVAKEIRESWSLEHVWITLGALGAVGAGEGYEVAFSPPKVRALSAVGCGDAFLAGWLYGFLTTEHPEEAGRLAIATAAANAEGWAPASFYKSRVEELYEDVRTLGSGEFAEKA